MEKQGKKQSYNRSYNNGLVINHLRDRGSASATELSAALGLSNAAMSSILKQLSAKGLIKVERRISVNGKGRCQVEYALNEDYGLVVCVGLANYQCVIALSGLTSEISQSVTIDVPKYDNAAITQIVLEVTKILMVEKTRKIPLRNIVISFPGRVTSEGVPTMSAQFDAEIFQTAHPILDAFANQFPSIPVYLANDINLSMIAEMEKGTIVQDKNAMLISIDSGIGGAFCIINKLFEGDQGYAGEFGRMHVEQDGRYAALDEFISFRALAKEASLTAGHPIHKAELVTYFHTNETFRQTVLNGAKTLGKLLSDIIELMDISTVVLSGGVVGFGPEYLAAVKEPLSGLPFPVTVEYSTLGNSGIIIGGISAGVKYILKKSTGRGDK
jgi:Transcriptional regulator/sugar kinase